MVDFVRVYFERDSSLTPNELLKICGEQIQKCEVDKFRNLNKLALLVNLISSALRPGPSVESRLSIQLAKNLIQVTSTSSSLVKTKYLNDQNVQIINTFNIGRGGISLSFMGNFITKSAHVSLLRIVRSVVGSDDHQTKLVKITKILF